MGADSLYAIGIDIGGTRIRVALGHRDRRLLHRVELATQPDPKGTMDAIALAVRKCLDATDASPQAIAGIGCSTAGTVDPKTHTIGHSPNLPHWEGFRLGKALHGVAREILGRDLLVQVENDANAAAWGIAHFEAPELQHLVYVTISTGIGGGILSHRGLHRGGTGGAGEVGHMILQPDGPRCGCGKRGCWEALSSGTAIARMGRERLGDPAITAQRVFERARAGDPEAQKIVEEAAVYLGVGFANLTEILDPEAIFVGGGVTASWDLLEGAMHNSYQAHVRWQVPIRLTTLGDDVGLLGAIALVWKGA